MHRPALAALLAASLGWGLAGVGSRSLFIEGTTTFTVVVLRAAIATAAVVAWLVFRTTRRPLSREVWLEGTLIGIPRIGLAPTFFIASLQFISAGFEAIIITLIPAVTAAMGAVWLDEKLNRLQIIGLIIGLAGAVILIASGESGLAEGGNAVTGGLLALGGVVAGASSGILARKYAPDHNTAELSGPMFISGAIVAFAASFLFEGVQPDTVTPNGWWILVALALGATLLPFVATLYAAKPVTATVTSLTGYVAPLVGVVGGVVILDEVLTTGILVGGALTMLGVIVVGRAQAVSQPRVLA